MKEIGSVWSQWDLHFHTPSSYDYKGKGVTNQDLIEGLEKNNISVVAITDHHVMDIARIKELQKLGKEKKYVFCRELSFCRNQEGVNQFILSGSFQKIVSLNMFGAKFKIERIFLK